MEGCRKFVSYLKILISHHFDTVCVFLILRTSQIKKVLDYIQHIYVDAIMKQQVVNPFAPLLESWAEQEYE